ncbi:BFD domain protein (2Fe-2S)-binding domain protein [Leptothrix cholodnii SP-6]|uniref:Bacterioferritin-associated ferredoxin n=1 Tax=Leptothrix cholodnii (strain ATCC 51168 / LMG 8142 / SP-6) TaxID=395495 RepID=B1XYX7_LEPCP|nr:(2Fe-2S)-binding protein [Leptothrix cholodnii]ACB32861.1 BFD domain protein (2Fe-2S)-binding domain protein [Leptothrix cholodnii SP-6]
MIVCLCNRVSDRDIRHAVQVHGVRDFEVLKDQTSAASCCGCCHDCAREVFDAACQTADGKLGSTAPAHG